MYLPKRSIYLSIYLNLALRPRSSGQHKQFLAFSILFHNHLWNRFSWEGVTGPCSSKEFHAWIRIWTWVYTFLFWFDNLHCNLKTTKPMMHNVTGIPASSSIDSKFHIENKDGNSKTAESDWVIGTQKYLQERKVLTCILQAHQIPMHKRHQSNQEIQFPWWQMSM